MDDQMKPGMCFICNISALAVAFFASKTKAFSLPSIPKAPSEDQSVSKYYWNFRPIPLKRHPSGLASDWICPAL